jgi:hypothetical protein
MLPKVYFSDEYSSSWVWWLIPVIPATWEVKIRRMAVRGGWQKVSETHFFLGGYTEV